MNENDSLEVTELLEMLYNMVVDAWSMPLNKDKCVIPREGALSLLDDIRAQMPIELSESRRLLAAKEEFISNAKREADTIRRAAEEEARRLVEENEVVKAARNRSNEIVNSADSKAKELMRVASEYVDDALRRTEEAINAALAEVRGYRAKFRSVAGSARSNVDVQPVIIPQEPEGEDY